MPIPGITKVPGRPLIFSPSVIYDMVVVPLPAGLSLPPWPLCAAIRRWISWIPQSSHFWQRGQSLAGTAWPGLGRQGGVTGATLSLWSGFLRSHLASATNFLLLLDRVSLNFSGPVYFHPPTSMRFWRGSGLCCRIVSVREEHENEGWTQVLHQPSRIPNSQITKPL